MLRLDTTVLTDPDAFAALAEPLLTRQPAEHTLIASILRDVRTGARDIPEALWVAVRDDTGVVGLAMWTAPWPPYLGPMPDEAAILVADVLAGHAEAVPGMNGEAEAVRAAVRRYQQHRPGATVTDTTGVRLHRLGSLVLPVVPGRARVATWDDRDLVEAWYRGFAVDIHHDPERATEGMTVHLNRETLLLWEVDGTPVSMAGRSPAAAGVARVGPVYTPPDHRRHGYAAAVTAEVSAQAQGPDVQAVVLFTDLGNPTSNKIYAEIGYRPVRDYLEISLSSPADPLPQ